MFLQSKYKIIRNEYFLSQQLIAHPNLITLGNHYFSFALKNQEVNYTFQLLSIQSVQFFASLSFVGFIFLHFNRFSVGNFHIAFESLDFATTTTTKRDKGQKRKKKNRKSKRRTNQFVLTVCIQITNRIQCAHLVFANRIQSNK